MSEIRYTKDHEYLRIEGAEGVIGISEYAQQQLGDVVFAETPPLGKALKRGDPAAVVESVKAAADVFAPLAGKVVEINETVVEDPSIVNSDAEGEGWFFRIELDDTDSFETLMDQDAYDEFLETL